MKNIPSVINVIATGDIMLGGNLAQPLKEKGWEPFFFHFSEYFKNADILFGNFEAPISHERPTQRNKILLYQDRAVIGYLKDLGYNILSIANNHIMDYGENGLGDTIQALREQGIGHIGAGNNAEDARKPARLSIKGKEIVFLGYVSSTTEKSHPIKYADKDTSGLVPLDIRLVEENIRQARDGGADIIIVSLHWGEETCHYPLPEQIEQGRSIINMGADVILGHHSHILQGIEKYKNGLIVYSLGNFVFGEYTFPDGRKEKWGERHKVTAFIHCTIGPDKSIDYEVFPLKIGDDLLPQILKGREKQEALSRIQQYSQALQKPNYKDFLKAEVRKEKSKIFIEKVRRKLF